MLVSNNSAVQISNCTFSSNVAVVGGGALHIQKQTMSNVLINSCFFVKNTAKQGGAICSTQGNSVEFVLKNCTFRENVASGSGGALVFHETSAKIVDSKFSNNTSPGACAVYFNGSKNEMHIERSSFWKHIPQPLKADATTVFVVTTKNFLARDVVFEENTCGLTLFDTPKAEVYDSLFHRNTQATARAPASALYTGNTFLYIQNASFVGNTGSKVMTLSVFGTNCQLHIQGCLFAANTGLSPIEISASQSIQVRSSNNVFVERQPQQYQNVFFLQSRTSAIIPAKFYFWQNMFEFSSNKTILIDGNFINNLSMPRIVDLRNVNATAQHSQFASGEFNIYQTSSKLVFCEFVLCFL